MKLRAWRDTWVWLAVSACGAPAWMTKSSSPKVSVFDAPPLAGATYVAIVEHGDFGHPGPHVRIEKGSFECSPLGEMMQQSRNGYESDDDVLALAKKKCDPAIATLLREGAGFVFVVDGSGPRWLSAEQVLAAALPIDSPAKALLAVWVNGKYELTWSTKVTYHGGPEDGRVRQVSGGYEVAGGTSVTDSDCGGAESRQTVTNYRHTLVVDAKGAVSERSKVVSQRYDIADPCHPMGRRPADFADISSGGTVHGYLVRALHHEAESVRAFERLARELAAYAAPDELIRATEQAARDERDHAARCAQLTGVPLAIACDDLPVRSLIDIAIDNAREGCIGESYSALVNVVQAQHATDARLRDHFAAIAADELTHAALAHAIAEWLDGVLSPDERAQVRAARDAAVGELAATLDVQSPSARELGMPHAAHAAKLLAAVAAV